MYICVCNAITTKDIEQAIGKGACSMLDLRRELKVGNNCGKCKADVKKILQQKRPSITEASNIFNSAVIAI